MMIPYPSPRRTSSGDPGTLLFRKRVLAFGDFDHIKFTESTLTSKADIVALINGIEVGLDPRQIELRFISIGAGGAGASGASAYGGLAAIPFERSLFLADVDDGDIIIDVGAGGLGTAGDIGNTGSASAVTFANGSMIYSQGGFGGTSDAENQRAFYTLSVGYGAQHADPTLNLDGPSSPYGPGCGGSRTPAYTGAGGFSNNVDVDTAGYPGFGFGEAGSNAPEFIAGRYGAGGASNADGGPGGAGGIPGGAGGAGDAAAAGGEGGRGEVQIQVIVWEIIR